MTLLTQIKHRPSVQGLVRAATSARRRLPRREIRKLFGLNQDASIAAVAGGYDAGGNMAKDGTRVMVYDVYNRLLSVANAATPAPPK